MSHANVYRHFRSKADLLDTVAARWLHMISDPLTEIVEAKGDAAGRLQRWFRALFDTKRRMVRNDPELFATYHRVAEASRSVVAAHIAELEGQIAHILRDGVAAGTFVTVDPSRTASVLFAATTAFHHPHFVMARAPDPGEADAVVDLLIRGLKSS